MVDRRDDDQHVFAVRWANSGDLEYYAYPQQSSLPALDGASDFGRWHQASGHEVRVARTTQDVLDALDAARKVPGGLHLRGAGHSMNGQTLPQNGIQLVLRFDVDADDLTMDERLRVLVPGSSTWETVVGAVEPQGRTIGVLTSHFDTSVGGTLSVSGAGPSALRFGRQVDLVERLQLVLADGSVLWCDSNEHPDLFRAALAGLGGIGVIRRAVLRTTDDRPYLVSVTTVHADWQGILDSSERLSGDIDALPSNLSQYHFGLVSVPVSVHGFEFSTLPDAIAFARSGVDEVLGIDGWTFLRVESRSDARNSLRSTINEELKARWGDDPGGLLQLWQDYVFPSVELVRQFLSLLAADLREPVVQENLYSRFGAMLKDTSTVHMPLSFYSPSRVGTGDFYVSEGFYFSVPRNKPDQVERIRGFLNRATETVFELGGRPYLYGWLDEDGLDMGTLYGESWDFYKRMKRSVDPDLVLNRGLFARLGLAN